MEYVRQLIDDALLFNPWISKSKEPDDVPENIRKEMLEKRKQWLKDGPGKV